MAALEDSFGEAIGRARYISQPELLLGSCELRVAEEARVPPPHDMEQPFEASISIRLRWRRYLGRTCRLRLLREVLRREALELGAALDGGPQRGDDALQVAAWAPLALAPNDLAVEQPSCPA